MSFEATMAEYGAAFKIARRARKMAEGFPLQVNVLATAMLVLATHANGTPLRLVELADADGADFSHDVFGIIRHLDRKTGHLGGCFVPRYAQVARS